MNKPGTDGERGRNNPASAWTATSTSAMIRAGAEGNDVVPLKMTAPGQPRQSRQDSHTAFAAVNMATRQVGGGDE